MIEVEITIGGHKFRIACAPGEEEQLDSAAKLLDREALALQSINGRVPETKMLLMAGLMLGDKIKSLEWEKASVKKDLINNKDEIMKPTINALVNVYKNISRCNYCGVLKSSKDECNCSYLQKKFSKMFCTKKSFCTKTFLYKKNFMQPVWRPGPCLRFM